MTLATLAKWIGGPLLRACGCLILIILVAEMAHGQTFPELEIESEAYIRSDDLIRLTTSYAEAVGEYRMADIRVKTLRSLGGSASLSGLEIQVSQIELAVAHSKVQVLHAIGEKMLAIAVARAEFLRRLQQEGNLPLPPGTTTSPQLRQAEADLRILQMILAMNPAQAAPVEQLPPGQ